jgi:hypothetical protein
MSRAKAVSSYRTQFARLRNPRYVLSGLKVKPGPDTATVSGRYAITDGGSSKGGGSVIFHLAKLGGRVVIQELDLTRG